MSKSAMFEVKLFSEMSPMIAEIISEMKNGTSFSQLIESPPYMTKFPEPPGPKHTEEIKALGCFEAMAEFSIRVLCEAARRGQKEIAASSFLRIIFPAALFYAEKFNHPLSLSLTADRYDLTNRERQIVSLLDIGKSAKQVAGELGISINTVMGAMRRVSRKTKSHSTLEALAKLRSYNPAQDPLAAPKLLCALKGSIDEAALVSAQKISRRKNPTVKMRRRMNLRNLTKKP
jgi:DNA-binding CsgD family transcriptional regulator